MANPFPTPISTPKRKRDEDGLPPLSPIHTTSKFSFQLPDINSDEDGSASPRSKVIHKFRGLALSGGCGGGGGTGGAGAGGVGGVPQQQGGGSITNSQRQGPYDLTRDVGDNGECNDDVFLSRKRAKFPEMEMKDAYAADAVAIPQSIVGNDPSLDPKPVMSVADAVTQTTASNVIQPTMTTNSTTTTTLTTEPTISIQKPFPSINRLQDSKSRGRKRVGTPPLKGGCRGKTVAVEVSTEKTLNADDDNEAMEVVDPVRAALTWKEEEITIYDPNDKDDDGTGINGVGFMPTAAMAHARTQKRRLQLAEYKKREESEARARRSQRRRGSGPGSNVRMESSKPPGGGVRKVRFIESEPTTIVTNG